MVHLSDRDLGELNAAAPIGATVGQRYPAPQMMSIQE